jgi:hypothetical protein
MLAMTTRMRCCRAAHRWEGTRIGAPRLAVYMVATAAVEWCAWLPPLRPQNDPDPAETYRRYVLCWLCSVVFSCAVMHHTTTTRPWWMWLRLAVQAAAVRVWRARQRDGGLVKHRHHRVIS